MQSYFPQVRAVADIGGTCFLTRAQTVYSEKCRSWYKLGKEEGRIVGLWPGERCVKYLRNDFLTLSFVGSSLHAQRVLRNPRWEDYEYELADEEQNSLYWLGDGQTYNEKTLTGDSTCLSPTFSGVR